MAVLHDQRFLDLAVAQVHARLLDEGRYLCSVSTMYRLLRANDEVRERRKIARHPEYRKPELLATGPRQVFSWSFADTLRKQKIECVQFEFGHCRWRLPQFIDYFNERGYAVGKILPTHCDFDPCKPEYDYGVSNFLAVRSARRDILTVLELRATESALPTAESGEA